MVAKLASIGLISFLILRSCGGGNGADAGPPPVDTGTPPVDTGPPPGDAGMEVPPEAAMALQAMLRGVGTSAALAGPLVSEGQGLRDDSRLDMPAMRDTTAREHVEMGVAGMSIVTDPMCVGFMWSGLSVSITFTDCVMEATGDSLSGTMTLAVSFFPTVFTMTFDNLMVATLGLDGEVSLTLGGACRDADPTCTPCADTDTMCAMMRMNQTTVNANVTVTLGTDFMVELNGVTVSYDSAGTTIDGSGTIGSTMSSGDFTATGVHWDTGDCLPSSGTLVYAPTTGLPLTVTFLSTTPDDGEVQVQVGPFMPSMEPLFEACPPPMMM